jgi:hypothetical protein
MAGAASPSATPWLPHPECSAATGRSARSACSACSRGSIPTATSTWGSARAACWSSGSGAGTAGSASCWSTSDRPSRPGRRACRGRARCCAGSAELARKCEQGAANLRAADRRGASVPWGSRVTRAGSRHLRPPIRSRSRPSRARSTELAKGALRPRAARGANAPLLRNRRVHSAATPRRPARTTRREAAFAEVQLGSASRE